MDFVEIDVVKAEKAIAMRRYRRIRKFANIFRCVEALLALAFLTWISFRLPIAVKISGELFRQFSNVVASPRFVFLVGNAIIITLVAKSGKFSDEISTGKSSASSGKSPPSDGGSDLYDEFLKISENRAKISPKLSDRSPTGASSAASDGGGSSDLCSGFLKTRDTHAEFFGRRDEDYVEKTICVVEDTIKKNCRDAGTEAGEKKKYRRSRSEVLVEAKKAPMLRRSETDACRKAESSPRNAEMSSEEFRQTVEAFIAKQLRFQRKESMAIVPAD